MAIPRGFAQGCLNKVVHSFSLERFSRVLQMVLSVSKFLGPGGLESRVKH